jgi:hypothetical protein
MDRPSKGICKVYDFLNFDLEFLKAVGTYCQNIPNYQWFERSASINVPRTLIIIV